MKGPHAAKTSRLEEQALRALRHRVVRARPVQQRSNNMYSSGSEDEEEELFGNGGRPAADEASEDSDGPQPSAYDQSYGSLGGDVLGEPDAPAQGSPRRRRKTCP